jgi:hypothetical protein
MTRGDTDGLLIQETRYDVGQRVPGVPVEVVARFAQLVCLQGGCWGWLIS